MHRDEVVGVDITDRFLDEARGAGLAVERADMRHVPFEDAFDVAICMWGSFGYFDDPGNRAVLAEVGVALDPETEIIALNGEPIGSSSQSGNNR